jgi:hypothetical protein
MNPALTFCSNEETYLRLKTHPQGPGLIPARFANRNHTALKFRVRVGHEADRYRAWLGKRGSGH